MLNSIFSSYFPFAYNYFSTLIESTLKNERKFPQGIILEGADTKVQYLFALELARVLSCQKNRTLDCDCLSCKWIRSFSNPNINPVSQIHYKPIGDETKTIISAKQALEIEKSLTLTSDNYRFFIFFSSKTYQYNNKELELFDELNYDTTKIDYSIEPLTYQTFHTTTLNALLKSIEEPPIKTVFVFLTKSKEDILPTIVSRCLTFKLGGKRQKNTLNVSSLLDDYPNINYQKALFISQNFQDFVKDNPYSQEEVLNGFLEFLVNNINNSNLESRIIRDIAFVKEAISYSRASINDKNIFDNLFLKIARGG